MGSTGVLAYGWAPPAARLRTLLYGSIPALLIVATAPAFADVSVRASLDTATAQVGQTVTLSIQVEGAQNVQAPALDGLEDFDAQYVGPTTQVSIVNGQMASQVQHRYTLTPKREGTFTLGPFAIDVGGHPYRTEPLRLTVTRAAPPPQEGAAAPGGSGEQLRLAISVPKTEVYLHEKLSLDVTLYIGSVQVADVQYPVVAAEGFSLEGFGRPRQFGQMIEGRRWDVVQFHAEVTPLQAGVRALGPASMRLNVVERQRHGGAFNDPFFQFGARRRPAEVRSNPVTLSVLPLPEEGKPTAFSGAVGKFTMNVAAAPTELRAGDPVTLQITIHGEGNLADARPPALVNGEAFKIYDPQVGTAAGNALRVFEQVLIPSSASVTSIPPVRFAYFDPEARDYRVIESAPIALQVRPAEGGQETRILDADGEQRVRREQLGRDIVYIKDELGTVQRRATPWYGNWLLLWWPVPPLLFAAAVAFERRRQRLSGDLRYARFTQARRNARRGLAQAEDALKQADPGAFYDQLSRTLQTYLADKLGLPPGAVDVGAIAACGISADSAERLRQLFEACERVRFAPSAADGDMRGVLTQAKDIIGRLEKERITVAVSPEAQS